MSLFLVVNEMIKMQSTLIDLQNETNYMISFNFSNDAMSFISMTLAILWYCNRHFLVLLLVKHANSMSVDAHFDKNDKDIC